MGLYGTQLGLVGRIDEAIEILEEMLSNNPGIGFGKVQLADAFHDAGRHDEELALMREHFDSQGQNDVVAAFDLGLREGGYTNAFARAADTLVVRARDAYVPAAVVSVFYAKAGETEKTLDWLEIMVEQREQNVPSIGVQSSLKNLHDHPRFQALVRRLGLPVLSPGGG